MALGLGPAAQRSAFREDRGLARARVSTRPLMDWEICFRLD
jgi:hypothetical protein